MKNEGRKRTIRNLIIFVVCIIAIPWLGVALDLQRGVDSHQQDGSLGWLFFILTPLAAVLILRAFAGDGWQDFGLKPAFKGNGKWYLFALLFHPLSMSLVLLVGYLAGVTNIPDFSAGKFSLVGQAILVGLLPSLIKNIFEEFAWRGYLTPKVQSIVERPLAGHTIVGLIWLTWHLPYYLVLLSPEVINKATSLSMLPFLLLGLAGIIPTAIIYGELRLWTGSVWPAVLIHMLVNTTFDALVLQKFFSFPSMGSEIIFAPGLYGILIIAINTTAGLWLYQQRMQKNGLEGDSVHA